MTETCSGAIFNLNYPAYDIKQGREFTSLGTCMPGIGMRITLDNPEIQSSLLLERSIPSILEVKGAVVFERYFDN